MSAGCLDDALVVALLDGHLLDSELAEVQRHLASCSHCVATLADAARGARASVAIAEPGDPKRVRRALDVDPELAHVLTAGASIDGKYRVERLLGHGGMGSVVAARHAELGHSVAIKILRRAGTDAAARFLREAQICANIANDHIVRVFDMGRLPDLEAQPRPEGTLSSGFFVCGGRLCDGAGHDFVIRGVNVPVVWYPAQALGWLDEIALTGANAVRLVWNTQGATPVLRNAIARAIALHLVPIVELHDVTGGTSAAELSLMAQYYIDELHDVLLEFEGQLLVNIANEWSGSDAAYHDAYRDAIDLLRVAGINHTLVIDANGYGQHADILTAQGPALLAEDPQHNLLFSVHMYQEFEEPQRMLDVLRGAASVGLPLIVGEFGTPQGVAEGEPGPIPFPVLLEEAEHLGVGYLAWVWTGFGDAVGSMDLSVDGSAALLTSWGEAVVNGPFGIAQTSRSASIFANHAE